MFAKPWKLLRSGMDRLTLHPAGALVAGGIGLCLAILATTISFLIDQRTKDIKYEGMHLRNVAVMVASNLGRRLGGMDAVMERLATRLQSSGIATAEAYRIAMTGPEMHATLNEMAASLPASDAILLLDAGGNLLCRSGPPLAFPVNVSDRAYFARLRDHPETAARITDPALTPEGDGTAFHLARRLSGAGASSWASSWASPRWALSSVC